MQVDPAKSSHRYEFGGTAYSFFSARCLEKFRANPDQYLNPQARDPAVAHLATGTLPEAAQGTIWTCPMHLEIRRDVPGSCPICGMALEPLEPSLEEGPNPELTDMSRRFWLSATLTVPLVVLTFGSEVLGWHPLPMRLATQHLFSVQMSMLLQLALATPVVLWGGWPFFARFWASLKSRNLNMFSRFLSNSPYAR